MFPSPVVSVFFFPLSGAPHSNWMHGTMVDGVYNSLDVLILLRNTHWKRWSPNVSSLSVHHVTLSVVLCSGMISSFREWLYL